MIEIQQGKNQKLLKSRSFPHLFKDKISQIFIAKTVIILNYIYMTVFKIFILSNMYNNNILPCNLPIPVNHCISFGWFPGLVINNVSCFLCLMAFLSVEFLNYIRGKYLVSVIYTDLQRPLPYIN